LGREFETADRTLDLRVLDITFRHLAIERFQVEVHGKCLTIGVEAVPKIARQPSRPNVHAPSIADPAAE
jgi:hypothetical protein